MPKNQTIEVLGLKITVRGWVSGADREYINEPINKAMDFDPIMQTPLPVKAGGIANAEMEKRTVEKFVISIENVSDEIKEAIKGWDAKSDVDKIYSLPDDAVADIVAKINKTVAKKAPTAGN